MSAGANLTRRSLLAGAGALAVAAPAIARQPGFPHRVPNGLIFFVGNSFTRQHAIPALVCSIAAASGTPAHCHPHTANGAWLDASTDFAEAALAERGEPIPGTVVLQDHSIAPISPHGRLRSTQAIRAWSAAFTNTVLFETWPRRDGHPLYSQRQTPGSPEEMAEIVNDHYLLLARETGAVPAPIGLAWLEAETEGIDLFAQDGYHANLAGGWLAAMMLARALDLPSPYQAPPPDGIDPATSTALARIAALHAYDPTL